MRRGYLLIVIIVAAALVLSVPIFNTTREDFSTYNTGWNGASQIQDLAARDGYSTRDIFSMSEAGSSGRGVLIMLNPNTTVGITDADARDLQGFVQNGGLLVLANDFGNGNAVLNGLGVASSVRFNGSLLADNVSRGVDDAHPLVTNITLSGITAGVSTLYFNYATALDTSGSNVSVLAQSSPTSYLRAPSGGNAQIVGSTGAKPVLATLDYGKGRIILLSDPSLFIDGMVGQADNQRLFTNIIANLTSGDTTVPILFDQSHRATQPLWSLAYDWVNTDDTLKYTIIVLFMAAFVLAANVVALARRPRRIEAGNMHVSEHAVIDDIIRTHPEWRKGRITKFLNQLQSQRRTDRGNRK